METLTSSATHWFALEKPFELESGEQLTGVHVAWLNATGDNAIIVNHALTGSADVESWWPRLLGPGRALDPNRDFIVCANLLGSCYGTTGPVSMNPVSGRAYGGAFPAITVRDMVCLQKSLIDHLGIRRIALAIGGSLGGMLTMEWALLYPYLVNAIAPIATAARQPPGQSVFPRRNAKRCSPIRSGAMAIIRPPHPRASALPRHAPSPC